MRRLVSVISAAQDGERNGARRGEKIIHGHPEESPRSYNVTVCGIIRRKASELRVVGEEGNLEERRDKNKAKGMPGGE